MSNRKTIVTVAIRAATAVVALVTLSPPLDCRQIRPNISMIIEMSDSIYKALADPHRRTILQLLRRRDMTVSEILERLPVSASTLSHHLDTLKRADLVSAEREGQFIRYSLNTSVFQDVMAFLTSLFPR